MDEVIRNKIAIIKRCLKRIREEYQGHESEFESNYTKQDSIILNLQKACESSIDLGMRIVAIKDLDVPQASRDVFILIKNANFIPSELSNNLQAMVGFRNIAVHDYQKVNLDIVKSIIEKKLVNFDDFINIIQEKFKTS